VVGAPAYYGRFGFAATPVLRLDGFPPEHFMALRLRDAPEAGRVAYHPSFLEFG
jgi:putative acetyltransferase